MQRHGVITRYIVNAHPVDNPANILYSYFNGESTLVGTVTGLHYWTEYSLQIAASTSAGQGPYSSAIIIKTEEHREAICTFADYFLSKFQFLNGFIRALEEFDCLNVLKNQLLEVLFALFFL